MSARSLLSVLVLAAGLGAGIPAPLKAEQPDTSFAGTGRFVVGDPAVNYRAVATLPLPTGNVVSVFELPTLPGVCAEAVCIDLLLLDETGTPLQFRAQAAGLVRVTGAAVDNSGRIVVVGQTAAGPAGRNISVSRFRASDLALDPLFGNAGTTVVSFNTNDEFPTAVAIDSVDRIVVAGSLTRSATDTDYLVARLASNGQLDSGFNAGTGLRSIFFDLGPTNQFDQANAVAIGNDGRIVVAGVAFDSVVSRFRVGLARLTPSGAADTTFCTTGCPANLGFTGINSGRTVYYFGASTAHSDEALAIETLGSGGFIVAGGTYSDSGDSRRAAIARFAATGSVVNETLHDGLGGNAEFRSVRAVDADGARIVVAGNSGPGSNYMLVQGFSASLAALPGFGNCLAGDSGFCLIVGTGLGDAGPDQGRSIAIDAGGRALFQGEGVAAPGERSKVLVARFSNSSGPRRDLIFRNGVN
jgi:uncharacterized delta-60 repeat protein